MRRSRGVWFVGFALAGFVLAIILVACGHQPTQSRESYPKRVTFTLAPDLTALGTVTGNGITLNFEKTSDWDGGNGDRGFTAVVTVHNSTGQVIDPWQLEFDFLGDITQMWNASHTRTGNRISVTPEQWNGQLQTGQSRSFGFNGSYSGPFQEPTSYVLSGVDVGPQGPVEPIRVTCTLDTRFVVTSEWEGGSGRGFVAEMYLTNVGQHPVNWRLGFDFEAEIVAMWNATFTVAAHHYEVAPDGWNTRIEPGETRSFGFQGTYTGMLREPSDVACDKPGPGLSAEGALANYYRAYANLSPAERQLYADGELIFDGLSFILPPQILKSGGSGLGPQDAQSPFTCPYPNGLPDHGTFYMLATRPGMGMNGDINQMSMSTSLPPAGMVSLPPLKDADGNERSESLYIGFGAWGSDSAEHVTIGGIRYKPAAFDAGIGLHDATGYYMVTNRAVETVDGVSLPNHVAVTAQPYRLRNLGQDGRPIPHTDNTKPYDIELSIEVIDDNHVIYTVTPKGNTVWVLEQWDKALQKVVITILDGPLSLGGTEVREPNVGNFPTDEYGNPLDAEPEEGGQPVTPDSHTEVAFRDFPEQLVPGMRTDGRFNRWSIQVNVATPNWYSPSSGTTASDIVIYDTKINGEPFNATNPNGEYYGFILTCPNNYSAAYSVNDGDTSSPTKEMGLKFDINIQDDNVHECDSGLGPQAAGQCSPDEPKGPQMSYGQSWGDPHIFTFDGGIYTFMATGDYVLVESTQPGDDFMIQVRFRPFEGPDWAHVDSTQWSANEAIAMNVEGDIVEFYAVDDDALPLVVINGQEVPPTNASIPLPHGGSVALKGNRATAVWPDGTSLTAELHASGSGDWTIAGQVEAILPETRWGRVQGLMGNNDGRVTNDLQLRDGTQLPLDPTPQPFDFSSETLTRELYSGPFRSSWLVQGYESLFSRGVNRFDPFYPSEFVNLDALNPSLVALAEAACDLEGASSPAVLSRCILDVANTGDELFAHLAAAADPRSPGVTISPPAKYLTSPQQIELTALVTGPVEDRTVLWSASAGSIAGSGTSITYLPPAELGEYTVTAILATDPGISATARVIQGEPLVMVPSTAIMGTHETTAFAVFGTASSDFTWSASGGHVSGEGASVTYTTPDEPGTYALAANVAGFTTPRATAIVSVPSETLTPANAYLIPGQSMRFRWVGAETLEVGWSATGGTIAADGWWTAPASVGDYTVVAELEDGRKAQASITVLNPMTEGGSPRLASGVTHTIMRNIDGTVDAWGGNLDSQLGNPSAPTTTATPVKVVTTDGTPLNGIVSVAAGNYHSLALRVDGTVWGWGSNSWGQLARQNLSESAVAIQMLGPGASPLEDVVAISAGDYSSFAIRADGTAIVWGRNALGRLCMGSFENAMITPHLIVNQSSAPVIGIAQISAGHDTTLLLQTDGTVWACGSNAYGGLGNPVAESATPVPVLKDDGQPLDGVVRIADGNEFGAALDSTRQVWVWGDDSPQGAHRAVRFTLVDGSPFTGLVDIVSSGAHALATHENGTLYAWGYNYTKQLGDGTTIDRAYPTLVLDGASPLTNVVAVSAGNQFSIALLNTGETVGWGLNCSGELGPNILPGLASYDCGGLN